MMVYEQLRLRLVVRPSLASDDFYVADGNRPAVSWIDRWPRWPTPALVVHGPAGSGKTHLGHLFIELSGAHPVSMETLVAADPESMFGPSQAVFVDDADRIVAAGIEAPLLHLYNTAQSSGRSLMLTARQPPSRWSMRLHDLSSRLNAATVVGIAPPDDEVLAAVLGKMLIDRQMKVDDGVIAFLLPRMERSFAAARRIVQALDEQTLGSRRKITPVLVRAVLRADAADHPSDEAAVDD